MYAIRSYYGRYAIDATRIRSDLGWEPQVSFEEGIEKTIGWYLANQEWRNNFV